MERRELITKSLMGLTVAGLAGKVMASTQVTAKGSASVVPYEDLCDAIANCIKAGEHCIAHCALELARGNVAMAKCNIKAHEMLACCKALLTFAAFESEFLEKALELCELTCKACKDACQEHAEHWSHGMQACKDCYEACKQCEEVCHKLLAA